MIGRTEEIALLKEQADADRSRFVVVYGRWKIIVNQKIEMDEILM